MAFSAKLGNVSITCATIEGLLRSFPSEAYMQLMQQVHCGVES